MRIMHLTPTALPSVGGAEFFLDALIRATNGLGHTCGMMLMNRKIALRHCSYRSVRVYQPRLRYCDEWLARWSIQREIRRQRVDLIHCHYGYPTGYLLSSSSVPWVITSHGNDLHFSSHHRAKEYHWRRIGIAYNRAAAVISIAPFIREVLTTQFHVPSERIVDIANGIDLAPFEVTQPRPSRAPAQPYLLFLGRHAPIKNADVLIRALASAGRSGFALVLAGAGPETGRWKALSHQLGVSSRVLFVGPVEREEKVAWLQHAAAVVIPSLEEACPLVPIEALACGRPLGLSNISALERYEPPGVKFPRMDPKSTEAWREYLQTVELHPSAELASRIRQFAAGFSIEQSAQQHVALYQAVLDGAVRHR